MKSHFQFKSQILIHPGLDNSGELHWQTEWEKRFPSFKRIQQKDWNTPACSDWVATIDETVANYDPQTVIIVGHSLACATVAFWAAKYERLIKGALLVAPSDSEADSYPKGTKGFSPMPLNKLPFPSITVTSDNDFYVSPDRARQFANAWGSELISIGDAGHINAASNLGLWEQGLSLLERLDK